ncbi:MAG: DNA polymerase III subunit chi [Gammaproteobacteria bacterium]|nr:DNA polymerase III subunit chi [Gammaproteobacteria bacterium]
MPRVDFYILADSSSDKRELFACRLAEKAYDADQAVYIYTDSVASARRVDELLWTFKQGSFIPHGLSDANPGGDAVLIGTQAPAENQKRQILLNLSRNMPPFFEKFERVMELVGDQKDEKTVARDRYKKYREAECEVHAHNIGR